MKIIITEPTSIENTKSIGCYFIENIIRTAGFEISYVNFKEISKHTADIWLFSVHHVKDIFHLAKMRELKGLLIGGGHVMNNPYPFLHFFDIICVGEGEDWILKILKLYISDKKNIMKNAENIAGTLTLKNKNIEIQKQYVDNININPIYLNKSNQQGHLDTWYIETGRGCKSKCAYCELGWTTPFREISKSKLESDIVHVAKQKNKRINIFAPDDYSVESYEYAIELIQKNGLQTKFGSMRLDRFSKINTKVKKNFLFRIGIDGLSERIRKIINKPNSNNKIYETITGLISKGYVMFKMFMIFSYQFETDKDWFEFVNLMERLKYFMKKKETPIFLRLKFTPFIPNPLTPLENFKPYYNIDRRKQIDMFFMNEKYQRTNIVFINDGILEPYSYYTQSFIARASYEDVNLKMLQNKKRLNFKSELLAKKTDLKEHKIITHILKTTRKQQELKILNRIKNENI